MPEKWDITPDEYGAVLADYTAEDYESIDDTEPYLNVMAKLLFFAQDQAVRYDQFAAMLDKDIDAKQPHDPSRLRKSIRYYADLLHNRSTRALNVLYAIDSVYGAYKRQEENSDRVTVLPLMCGYGKSSAIKQLIRDTIKAIKQGKSTDGLLIVTDDKARLADYLKDDEDDRFLKRNQHMITLMTAENMQQAMQKQYYAPVLLMTTQRYFSLSTEEINGFLEWKNGCRPLVIIDEKPLLREIRTFSHKQINDIASAIADGIATDDDKDWAYGQWECIRQLFHQALTEGEQKANALRKKSTETSATLFFNGVGHPITEDDDRLLLYLKDHSKELIRYRKSTNCGMIYEDAASIIKILKEGALYFSRQSSDSYDSYFSLLIDHHEAVTDVNAKVIILDGTGDIHPDYREEEVDIRREDTKYYARSLARMKLRFVDLNTSAAKLSTKQEGADWKKLIVDYLASIDLGPDAAPLFTYERHEKYFASAGYITDHFGAIKGSNEYRDYTSIVQVGLNRFPDAAYLCYYLDQYPVAVDELRGLTDDEQAAMIKSIMKTTEYRSIRDRILLADLEQNMFRCKIRDYDYGEDALYLVMCDTDSYSNLIEQAQERFGRHGAQIEVVETPAIFQIGKALARNTADGTATNVQLVLRYIESLPSGSQIKRRNIVEATGLDVKQVKKVLENNKAELNTLMMKKEGVIGYVRI